MAKKDRPAQLGFSSTTYYTSLPTFPALGFGRVFHWFVSVRFRDSNRSDGYFSQSCSIFVSLSLPVSSCYSVLLTWPYVIDTPVFIYYLSKKYDRLLCLSLVVYLFVWNVFCPIFPPTTSHPEKRKKTFATQRLRNSRVTACRPSPLKKLSDFGASERVCFIFVSDVCVWLTSPWNGIKNISHATRVI